MPVAAVAPFIGPALGIGGSLLNRGAGDKTSQMYDPYTMEVMRQLTGQGASVLGDYMKDPWAAGFFQNQLARASEATGARAANAYRNLLNPALGVYGATGRADTGAISNPSAFLASEMNRIARGASRERADTLSTLLSSAENLRRGAAGAALGYRPLPTGTTQKSGSLLGNILGGAGTILGSIGPSNQAIPSTVPYNTFPTNQSLYNQYPNAAGYNMPLPALF